jgi:DNA-binding CsgD family transcriptional regulator
MFETLVQRLGVEVGDCQERDCGAAFFRVAREAYPLASIVYVALNIPLPSGRAERFVHCTYSDAWARHSTTKARADVKVLGIAPLFWEQQARGGNTALSHCNGLGERELSIALTSYHAESAALVITADEKLDDWPTRRATLTQELRALGQYFHQHMLRIFGRGNERALIVTAREIDCLRWMAAGKTALEASTILGITERTVRFHLNAAREKLDCTTTTQAVAKAVSQQLFVP